MLDSGLPVSPDAACETDTRIDAETGRKRAQRRSRVRAEGGMLAFAKLLVSFAPWLAFLFIAHDSLWRVEVGLVVALVLSVIMGVLRLHRGIILWVGLVFFSVTTVAVIVFDDTWTLKHLGVLANGALAAGAWLTVLIGKPFTLDYAKEHVDPSLWSDPRFVRSNTIITSLWAATFTINAGLAFVKMERLGLSDLACEIASYSLLVGTAVFTVWFPSYLHRKGTQART
jgi:hypothetical protein